MITIHKRNHYYSLFIAPQTRYRQQSGAGLFNTVYKTLIVMYMYKTGAADRQRFFIAFHSKQSVTYTTTDGRSPCCKRGSLITVTHVTFRTALIKNLDI